jgi:hypothetical protein
MTVEAIKAAIEELPAIERHELASWLGDIEQQAWDQEIERDFSAGGRGMGLLEELQQETAEGRTTGLEEGVAERRRRRS